MRWGDLQVGTGNRSLLEVLLCRHDVSHGPHSMKFHLSSLRGLEFFLVLELSQGASLRRSMSIFVNWNFASNQQKSDLQRYCPKSYHSCRNYKN